MKTLRLWSRPGEVRRPPGLATDRRGAWPAATLIVSSTGLRHTRNRVGFTQPLNVGGVYEFGANVDRWHVTGSLRYNLLAAALKPYLNAGTA